MAGIIRAHVGFNVAASKFVGVEQLADLTKLSIGWCEETLRLVALAAPSAESAPDSGGDGEEMHRQLQAQAAHQFAIKTVRPLILESLALTCWEAVIEHARKREPFGPDVPRQDPAFKKWLGESVAKTRQLTEDEIHRLWVQRQIGLRLGTDATNLGRWERFKTLPGGEKVLGALIIALRAEFDEVQFPNRRFLLSRAVARTLAFIRELQNRPQIKPKEGRRRTHKKSKRARRLPLLEEINAVRLALRHKFADALIPPEGEADQTQLRELYTVVSCVLEEKYPNSSIWRTKTLKRVIGRWATTYALFRLALVSGWPDGGALFWNWRRSVDVDAS